MEIIKPEKEFKPEVSLKRIEIEPVLNPASFAKDLDGTLLFSIVIQVDSTNAATSTLYGAPIPLPVPCTLVQVQEVHGVAGSDAGAVTVTVEKLTGTTAKGSGIALLSSAFDLKGTANTVATKYVTSGLVETVTSGMLDRSFDAGDRVALKTSGTLTAVSDVAVTLLFKTEIFNLSQ